MSSDRTKRRKIAAEIARIVKEVSPNESESLNNTLLFNSSSSVSCCQSCPIVNNTLLPES